MAEVDTITFSKLDEGAVKVEAKINKVALADLDVPTPPNTPAESNPMTSSKPENNTIRSNSSSTTTLAADPEPRSEEPQASTTEPTKQKSKKEPKAASVIDIASETEQEVVASSPRAKSSNSKTKKKKDVVIQTPSDDSDSDELSPAPKPHKTTKGKTKKKATPSKPKNPDSDEDSTVAPSAPQKVRKPRPSPDDATKQMIHLLHLMVIQLGGPKGMNWKYIARNMNMEGGMHHEAARSRYRVSYDSVLKGRAGDGADNGVSDGEGERSKPAKKGPSKAKKTAEPKSKKRKLSDKFVRASDEEDSDQVMAEAETVVKKPRKRATATKGKTTSKARPKKVKEVDMEVDSDDEQDSS